MSDALIELIVHFLSPANLLIAADVVARPATGAPWVVFEGCASSAIVWAELSLLCSIFIYLKPESVPPSSNLIVPINASPPGLPASRVVEASVSPLTAGGVLSLIALAASAATCLFSVVIHISSSFVSPLLSK